MKHRAKIIDGEIKLQNPERFRDDIKSKEGKDVYVSISRVKSKRSLNQNAYYWGVALKVLSDATGHTEAELHEYFKSRYLILEERRVFNEVIVVYRSTADLTTTEFERYLRQVRVEASEMDVYIPLPNEVEIPIRG